MTNKQTSKFTRNLGIVTFLDDNTAAYAGDVAFEAIVTKIKIDIAADDAAAVETAADNTGYSIDKLIAKNDVSELASE